MYKQRKIIIVDSCQSCPYEGVCEQWSKLTKQETVRIVLGVGSPKKFILNGCPLPNGEDNSEPFNKEQ